MVFSERLDPTSLDWRNFIVAEEDGAIVGMAQVKPYSDCREFGSLAVRPSHRERGIGGMLIRALITKEQGDVWLLCREVRAPYYSKFGFRIVAREAAPKTLQRKLRWAQLFAAFGIRVVCMKRSRATVSRREPRVA